jgi:hypothetical protein
VPTIQNIKDWLALVVALVTFVAGIIFWVQTSSDEKIAVIEKDMSELKADIRGIQADNKEIIRIIGRLEGLIEKAK